MNLKSIVTGAAIAATLVAGGVVTMAPAHAGDLKFSGTARLKNAGVALAGTSVLDFAAFNGALNSVSVGTGTGTVAFGSDAIFGAGPFTLKDLALKKLTSDPTSTTWQLVNPVASFITGLAGGATYNLSTFNLTRVLAGSSPVFSADYTGVFNNVPGGIGTLVSGNLALNNGISFSSTVTGPPIPTPALLPGLMGLGVAALRKRKGEGSEAEKETVGVKA